VGHRQAVTGPQERQVDLQKAERVAQTVPPDVQPANRAKDRVDVMHERAGHEAQPTLSVSTKAREILTLVGLALTLGLPAPVTAAQQPATDPDLLYAAREHVPSALEAADIWEARLRADPRDFEAAWKLARACYWLGSHVAQDQRRAQYERGIKAATRAVELEPGRPEGHFWMAADMGAMAESFGIRAGLRYRGPVKRALETVLKIDAPYQQGSADRALGRWYFRVPRLFGGSRDKAVEHLRRSLTYAPDSSATHFFLAEAYLDMDRHEDARREARLVIEAPLHPEWTPEDREFKQKAMALLERIR
jgi:tetratricopeptide (TPR) repeat protein